jgi:hypothetical protein
MRRSQAKTYQSTQRWKCIPLETEVRAALGRFLHLARTGTEPPPNLIADIFSNNLNSAFAVERFSKK